MQRDENSGKSVIFHKKWEIFREEERIFGTNVTFCGNQVKFLRQQLHFRGISNPHYSGGKTAAECYF